jgi:hypothetical protein
LKVLSRQQKRLRAGTTLFAPDCHTPPVHENSGFWHQAY